MQRREVRRDVIFLLDFTPEPQLAAYDGLLPNSSNLIGFERMRRSSGLVRPNDGLLLDMGRIPLGNCFSPLKLSPKKPPADGKQRMHTCTEKQQMHNDTHLSAGKRNLQGYLNTFVRAYNFVLILRIPSLL